MLPDYRNTAIRLCKTFLTDPTPPNARTANAPRNPPGFGTRFKAMGKYDFHESERASRVDCRSAHFLPHAQVSLTSAPMK